MSQVEINVLVVDDDEVDVETVQYAFEERQLAHPITVAKDGEQALQILRGEAGYVRLAKPFVILLDINMPRMNGIEFLRELRADPDLADSVVFMLTTSNSQRDVEAAYNLQVAGYMSKNEVGNSFEDVSNMLDQYGRSVLLPR